MVNAIIQDRKIGMQLKKLIRYLRTTKDRDFHISSKEYPNIVAYSDANRNQDAADRK